MVADMAFLEQHRHDGRRHGLLGMSGGAEQGVEAEVDVGNHVTGQDYLHVLAGIRYSVLARPEEVEYRVEEGQGHYRKEQTDKEIKHHHVAQHLLRDIVVLLAEEHRGHGRGSDSDEGAESRRKVHEGEGKSQSGDGVWPYAVADEDSVDHIVERGGGHGDDRRDSVLFQKFGDSLCPQLSRYSCIHAAKLHKSC